MGIKVGREQDLPDPLLLLGQKQGPGYVRILGAVIDTGKDMAV